MTDDIFDVARVVTKSPSKPTFFIFRRKLLKTRLMVVGLYFS